MRGQLAVVASIVVVGLAFVFVATAVVGELSSPDEAQPSAGAAATSRPAGVPTDATPAIVERIVDGDTLQVTIADQGSERVRLLNIDTPELARDGRPAQCLAAEATERLLVLAGPGEVVWLAADVEDRDRYDRLLRGLWTADGAFVNRVLAAEGLAEALLIAPNDRFHAPVLAAQRTARAEGLGRWGAACSG